MQVPLTGVEQVPLAVTLGLTVAGLVFGGLLGAVAGHRRSRVRQLELTTSLQREQIAQAELKGQISALTAERDRARDQAAASESLASVIGPLRENVEALRRMTIDAHDRRTQAESALTMHIEQVQGRYASLEQATEQLVAALSRGQTRGQWGEMQLEQLLHHAGLIDGVHFSRQRTSADGARRPDIVMHLPGGHEIAIDAKFPFDAYWAALASTEPAERERGMRQHAADLLARVRDLASKGYHRGSHANDIVVLFLPLESLLSSALEVDGAILEQAFSQRVVLATPTTLLALLRTAAFAFDRAQLARSTEEVRQVGGELLQRLGALVEHIEGMRKGLAAAVNGYNAFVGSFDRHALVQARRMRDLGVPVDRQLEAPSELPLDIRTVRGA